MQHEANEQIALALGCLVGWFGVFFPSKSVGGFVWVTAQRCLVQILIPPLSREEGSFVRRESQFGPQDRYLLIHFYTNGVRYYSLAFN